MDNLEVIISALNSGKVIAYPTEGVFGIGCDPDNNSAIEALLMVKNRSVDKGLILIAASYDQIQPYIDETALSTERLEEVKSSWPGPITWVVPASNSVSDWVTGQFDSVAVRVTDHVLVRDLCLAYGKPITSTSANLSGLPPCLTGKEVSKQLGGSGVVVLNGETGGRNKPSEIRDALSGKVLRQG